VITKVLYNMSLNRTTKFSKYSLTAIHKEKQVTCPNWFWFRGKPNEKILKRKHIFCSCRLNFNIFLFQ
jgi:hypothetical protein